MKERNIKNLVSLWMLTGKAFDAYRGVSGFDTINIDLSEWPNRIWSYESMTSDRIIEVKRIIREINPALTFSEWKGLNESDSAIEYDMRLNSMQIGVSLWLKDYNMQPTDSQINLIPIGNSSGAGLWSSLFQQSFGYLISDIVIDRIKDQVAFFNLKFEGQFVGTVAINKLDNSIGIHSLGITEQFRKRGLAGKVMRMILADAKNEGIDYVHLQSSPMGMDVYKRIGFEEIFKMYNYKIEPEIRVATV